MKKSRKNRKLLRKIENKSHFNNENWKHSKYTNRMSGFAPELHRVLPPFCQCKAKNQGRNKDFKIGYQGRKQGYF